VIKLDDVHDNNNVLFATWRERSGIASSSSRIKPGVDIRLSIAS
jgi:hypothetical protein